MRHFRYNVIRYCVNTVERILWQSAHQKTSDMTQPERVEFAPQTKFAPPTNTLHLQQTLNKLSPVCLETPEIQVEAQS